MKTMNQLTFPTRFSVVFFALALPIVGAFVVNVAMATPPAEYADVKPLLFAAIDAPDGQAIGTLIGPISRLFRASTGSQAPVRAVVKTVKQFKRPGCKRLSMLLSQANVAAQDGRQGEFTIDYGINVCRDGLPPAETMSKIEMASPMEPGTEVH